MVNFTSAVWGLSRHPYNAAFSPQETVVYRERIWWLRRSFYENAKAYCSRMETQLFILILRLLLIIKNSRNKKKTIKIQQRLNKDIIIQ